MRGRHPSGIELIGADEGSEQARHRLKAMLETLAGQKRIGEACAELGIGEAQFHKLRRRMLEGALESLEPLASGRPPSCSREESRELAARREEIEQLRWELRAAQIREEIALLMPHLLKAPEEQKKTGKRAHSDGGKGGMPNKSGGSGS
jgi:hypothetical protein